MMISEEIREMVRHQVISIYVIRSCAVSRQNLRETLMRRFPFTNEKTNPVSPDDKKTLTQKGDEKHRIST